MLERLGGEFREGLRQFHKDLAERLNVIEFKVAAPPPQVNVPRATTPAVNVASPSVTADDLDPDADLEIDDDQALPPLSELTGEGKYPIPQFNDDPSLSIGLSQADFDQIMDFGLNIVEQANGDIEKAERVLHRQMQGFTASGEQSPPWKELPGAGRVNGWQDIVAANLQRVGLIKGPARDHDPELD